ncbi:hypothetical protein [Marimonas arenosa]|nr:hypothetical protein [Marimonas arenosa]
MPLPLLAYPVLHSSGQWIAYAGAGYVANTLSATWIGAFILGNSSLLASVGLVSGAGFAAASGALAGFGASAAAGLGKALTAVGLGGVASWLGIAPTVTFLGLTPAGWAAIGMAAVVAVLGAIFSRRFMKKLNDERVKGGLGPITVRQIVSEVQKFEGDAKRRVLEALAQQGTDIQIDGDDVQILGQVYSIERLRYRINKDGSEEIGYVTRLGRFVRIYLVKPGDEPQSGDPLPI